jgi:sugar/nucleoside kinase (ribokinase family)
MEKRFDVLVIGELNIDLILNDIESFPEMGKEKISRKMSLVMGSSSAIFASNIASLGNRVGFIGKTGDDSFGELVLNNLETRNVDTSLVIKNKETNTGATIVLNFGQDRAMVTYPGAMNDLKLTDISDKALKSASHMHLSSIFLQQALMPDVVGVFKRAKALGMTTSFDPQWDPQEKWDIDLKELLPFVDIFLPNAGELMQFTAQSSIEAAIDSIKGFCQVVVVKNGVEGAMMWDKSHLCVQQAFLNNEVKDAIGAGDSFNSGFIYKFIHKKPLKECLEFAALTGAINTTASGGTTAFRSFENIKTIAREKFNYTI